VLFCEHQFIRESVFFNFVFFYRVANDREVTTTPAAQEDMACGIGVENRHSSLSTS
jgi:hypothetical protein